MQKFKVRLLIFTLVLSFSVTSVNANESCKSVLSWIYHELTLNNLDKSYERLGNKLLLSLYHLQQNTKRRWRGNKQVTKIYNTLRKLDADLASQIKSNRGVYYNNLFNLNASTTHSSEDLQSVINEFYSLQKKSPHLFNGLKKEYFLDDWDLHTTQILNNVQTFNFSDNSFKEKMKLLAQQLKNKKQSVLNGKSFDEAQLRQLLDGSNKKLLHALIKDYADVLNDYSEICNPRDLKKLISKDAQLCPLLINDSADIGALSKKLNQLSSIIKQKELLNIKDSPPLVKINKLDYKTSTEPNATYCERDPKMIGYIVIHHTGTDNSTTPHKINSMHLQNGKNAPWYMIGYNYVVSETFDGATAKGPKVFQGRPSKMKGAHAGTHAYTTDLSSSEREFYDKQTMKCGNPKMGIPFKTQSVTTRSQMSKNGKGISGNLVSLGIAAIGNYAPAKFDLIDGVRVYANASATKREYPSQSMIKKLAALSCQLQRENKNINKIVPHNYFNNTSCPGDLKKLIGEIADRANELGCNFKSSISKEEGFE